MRVLHVGKFYPPYRGGMETHLQILAERLQRSVDVRVVVSSSTRSGARERINGIDVTRLATSVRIAGASVSYGLRRLMADTDAEIVHLHLPNPTAILAYLASGRRGPLIVTYHSDIVRQAILGAAFAPILHRFLSQCTAIIVGSPNYLESSSTLRRHKDRCHVIPFGIDLEPYACADIAAVAEIRQQYGPRLVLGVGRLVGYKGFSYLLDAMPSARCHLLIAGEGPLRGELERQSVRLGVADRVTWLGDVADVAPYYHAADLFVLSSVTRAEAFGLAQLEAMASGKPVVNTNLASGVPFVSRTGETGLTVPPRDAPALANAINRILDETELRVAMGNAARRRALECFGATTMVQRTLDLYRRVLNTNARSVT